MAAFRHRTWLRGRYARPCLHPSPARRGHPPAARHRRLLETRKARRLRRAVPALARARPGRGRLAAAADRQARRIRVAGTGARPAGKPGRPPRDRRDRASPHRPPGSPDGRSHGIARRHGGAERDQPHRPAVGRRARGHHDHGRRPRDRLARHHQPFDPQRRPAGVPRRPALGDPARRLDDVEGAAGVPAGRLCAVVRAEAAARAPQRQALRIRPDGIPAHGDALHPVRRRPAVHPIRRLVCRPEDRRPAHRRPAGGPAHALVWQANGRQPARDLPPMAAAQAPGGVRHLRRDLGPTRSARLVRGLQGALPAARPWRQTAPDPALDGGPDRGRGRRGKRAAPPAASGARSPMAPWMRARPAATSASPGARPRAGSAATLRPATRNGHGYRSRRPRSASCSAART